MVLPRPYADTVWALAAYIESDHDNETIESAPSGR